MLQLVGDLGLDEKYPSFALRQLEPVVGPSLVLPAGKYQDEDDLKFLSGRLTCEFDRQGCYTWD